MVEHDILYLKKWRVFAQAGRASSTAKGNAAALYPVLAGLWYRSISTADGRHWRGQRVGLQGSLVLLSCAEGGWVYPSCDFLDSGGRC